MLPLKTTLTAAIAAAALALGGVAPAYALGKNERNFLKGLAAAAIVGAIANDIRQKNRRAEPQQQYYAPQGHVQPQGRYRPDHQTHRTQPQYRNQPQYQTGRVIGSGSNHGAGQTSGLYQTAPAQAFNSYSSVERRAIQRRLAQYGYYAGSIDGAFGPRTHQAIYEFARAAGRTDALNSTSGAYGVMDALLS